MSYDVDVIAEGSGARRGSLDPHNQKLTNINNR